MFTIVTNESGGQRYSDGREFATYDEAKVVVELKKTGDWHRHGMTYDIYSDGQKVDEDGTFNLVICDGGSIVSFWHGSNGVVGVDTGALNEAMPPVEVGYSYGRGDTNMYYARRSGNDALEFISDSWIHGRHVQSVKRVR